MPAQYTKKGLKDLVKDINNKRWGDLSHRKIYSDVKKIMSRNPDQVPDLVVGYLKKLNKQLFEEQSYYRSLSYCCDTWSEDYKILAGYSITNAYDDAKQVFDYCVSTINPDFKYELDEKQHKALSDWQLAQLQPHTEYAETVRMMKAWTLETVDEALTDCEKSLGCDQNDPSKIHVYNGEDLDIGKDSEIASIYCKAVVFREELDRHGPFWKWIFSRRVEIYNSYIKRAEEIFKKVGFDENAHGNKVMDHVKTSLFYPYSMAVDDVKMKYVQKQEKRIENGIDEINDARDYQKKAAELNTDPEFGLPSKLTEYAERYGLDASTLVNPKTNWASIAESYDKTRDTGKFKITIQAVFSNTVRKLFAQAAELHGADLDVARILKDAREITVIATKFNSIAYSLDDFKNAETTSYLGAFTPEYIEERVGFYLKENNALSKEEKANIGKAAAEVLRGWHADPAKIVKEDVAFAAGIEHPEFGEYSPVEENIINNLLTIGYRPPSRSNSDLIRKHGEVAEKLQARWFAKGSKHIDGADTILAKNIEKYNALKKIQYDKEANEDDLKASWDKQDRETREKFKNYNPRKLEDLQQGRDVRQSEQKNREDDKKDIEVEKKEGVNNQKTVHKETVTVILDSESSKVGVSPQIKEAVQITDPDLSKK